MEQSLISRILAKLIFAIFIIALFDLVFLNWWILKKTPAPSTKQIIETSPLPSANPNGSFPNNSPSPSAQNANSQKTEKPTVADKQTIVQTPQKEIFIPLGSGSTNTHDFGNLSGMQATIDTTNYPPIDSAFFEGSIWVEGGNGQAYVQLFNDTDAFPYENSKLSSNSPTGVFETVKINLFPGTKTYKVQAKTDITNFAAHIDNAKIKIILK